MTTEKEYEPFGDEWFLEMKKWNKTMLIDYLRTTLIAQKEAKNISSNPVLNADATNWQEKYEKCIKVIKRFDAGIIGMYDL